MITTDDITVKEHLEVKQELSGDNPNPSGYGHSKDVAPYVPSTSPLPPGDLLSPKAQREQANTPANTVTIQKGMNVAPYLPATTGAYVKVTYESGRPNLTFSLPSQNYTDIANNLIQSATNKTSIELQPNIVTLSSVAPPRDSSADRGAASTVVSPLSNATPNTTTTYTEPTKIRING